MDILIPGALLLIMLILATLLAAERGAGPKALDEQIRRLAGEPAEKSEIDITRKSAAKGNKSPDQLLSHVHLLKRLELLIIQAGLYYSASQVLLIMLLLAGAGAAAGTALRLGLVVTGLLGLALSTVPLIYLRIRKRQRVTAFGSQLPEVLDLLKSSLQAGHSLLRGLQVVSEEFPDPASSEFRLVLEQARLGIPVARAFEAMFQRIPEESLRFLLVAIKVQQEVGSSLAGIIGRLAETVRSRQRIKLQIKTLTAQPRMSGWVVGCLPVLMILYYAIAQPLYFNILFHNPLGQLILKSGIAMDVMGILVIRRIVKADY
jgi:tight adherence protein B